MENNKHEISKESVLSILIIPLIHKTPLKSIVRRYNAIQQYYCIMAQYTMVILSPYNGRTSLYGAGGLYQHRTIQRAAEKTAKEPQQHNIIICNNCRLSPWIFPGGGRSYGMISRKNCRIHLYNILLQQNTGKKKIVYKYIDFSLFWCPPDLQTIPEKDLF